MSSQFVPAHLSRFVLCVDIVNNTIKHNPIAKPHDAPKLAPRFGIFICGNIVIGHMQC